MCDAYSFLLYVALVTILYGKKYHCWLISDVLLQKCWVGIKFWLLGTFVVWCFYSVIHYLPWWVFCSFVRKQFLRHQPKMSHLQTFVLTVSVHLTYMGYYNFASAVVAVYSSRMTVSSSASWSTFSLPSNFVSVHVSTMWVVVCHWPQSQEGDWGNVWEQLAVWQPCELLYTCYLLTRSGFFCYFSLTLCDCWSWKHATVFHAYEGPLFTDLWSDSAALKQCVVWPSCRLFELFSFGRRLVDQISNSWRCLY